MFTRCSFLVSQWLLALTSGRWRPRSRTRCARVGVEDLEGRTLLSTDVTFDLPGTPYATYQEEKPPAPQVLSDGPTGNYLRIAYATADPPNVGTFSVARSDVGAYGQVDI